MVLLQALIAAWPAEGRRIALLDARARYTVMPAEDVEVRWVEPRVGARWFSEWHLRRATGPGDTVLCFHGLPPLWNLRARVWVFQQNRNYLGLNPLSSFKRRTALRLAFERGVSRLLRRHVDAYIVQTPTMARALKAWHGDAPTVYVQPFIDEWVAPARAPSPRWDFIYVADGEAHKNHAVLLEAWELLARKGRFPSLALTLGPRDGALVSNVDALRAACGAQIQNLSGLSRNDVLALYADARALVFPSTSESFGLPLVEAARCGLPIVAAVAEYVREVCVPTLTFDAASPASIAQVIESFLDQTPSAPVSTRPNLQIGRPEDLWRLISTPPKAPA